MARGPVGPDDETLVSDEPGGGPRPAAAPFGIAAPGSLAKDDVDMADAPTIVPGFGAPAMSQAMCPKCGMANGADAAFCIRCGGSLRGPAAAPRPAAAAPLPPPPMPVPPPATAICGQCGAENDPGSRFCIQCGGQVGGVAAAPRPPAAPPPPPPPAAARAADPFARPAAPRAAPAPRPAANPAPPPPPVRPAAVDPFGGERTVVAGQPAPAPRPAVQQQFTPPPQTYAPGPSSSRGSGGTTLLIILGVVGGAGIGGAIALAVLQVTGHGLF